MLDPVQSISGHTVVMEAFRTIDPYLMAMNSEPRISTSLLAHVHIPKSTIESRMRGLNKLFYNMIVKTDNSQQWKEGGGINELDIIK